MPIADSRLLVSSAAGNRITLRSLGILPNTGTDLTAAMTAALAIANATGLGLQAEAGIYYFNGLVLAYQYLDIEGAGKGQTIFRALNSGTTRVLTIGDGSAAGSGTNGSFTRLANLTVNGFGFPADGVVLADNAANCLLDNVEIIRCGANTGNWALRNLGHCQSTTIRSCLVHSNDNGIKLILNAQNTHLLDTRCYSNPTAGGQAGTQLQIGDDTLLVNNIMLTGGQYQQLSSGTTAAADNINVQWAQVALIGVYFEENNAGSSNIHLAGTHGSTVAEFGSLGSLDASGAPHMLVDAAVKQSLYIQSGSDVNNLGAGARVVDNSGLLQRFGAIGNDQGASGVVASFYGPWPDFGRRTKGIEPVGRHMLASTVTLTSQTVFLLFFQATRELTLTQMEALCAAVASGTTSCQFGIYTVPVNAAGDINGALTLVASTPNDTTLFSVATAKTPATAGTGKALSAPLTLIPGNSYALAVWGVWPTTAPTARGIAPGLGATQGGDNATVGASPAIGYVLALQAALPASIAQAALQISGSLPWLRAY